MPVAPPTVLPHRGISNKRLRQDLVKLSEILQTGLDASKACLENMPQSHEACLKIMHHAVKPSLVYWKKLATSVQVKHQQAGHVSNCVSFFDAAAVFNPPLLAELTPAQVAEKVDALLLTCPMVFQKLELDADTVKKQLLHAKSVACTEGEYHFKIRDIISDFGGLKKISQALARSYYASKEHLSLTVEGFLSVIWWQHLRKDSFHKATVDDADLLAIQIAVFSPSSAEAERM